MKNAFIEIKREHTKNFFETLQANYSSRNSRQFYKSINSDRADFNQKRWIAWIQGNLLTETQGILDRWVEHFDQLLNVSGPNENQQMEVMPQAVSELSIEAMEFRKLKEARQDICRAV